MMFPKNTLLVDPGRGFVPFPFAGLLLPLHATILWSQKYSRANSNNVGLCPRVHHFSFLWSGLLFRIFVVHNFLPQQ
jgi:hypothetical protein